MAASQEPNLALKKRESSFVTNSSSLVLLSYQTDESLWITWPYLTNVQTKYQAP